VGARPPHAVGLRSRAGIAGGGAAHRQRFTTPTVHRTLHFAPLPGQTTRPRTGEPEHDHSGRRTPIAVRDQLDVRGQSMLAARVQHLMTPDTSADSSRHRRRTSIGNHRSASLASSMSKRARGWPRRTRAPHNQSAKSQRPACAHTPIPDHPELWPRPSSFPEIRAPRSRRPDSVRRRWSPDPDRREYL
jgi:hypothetical protein